MVEIGTWRALEYSRQHAEDHVAISQEGMVFKRRGHLNGTHELLMNALIMLLVVFQVEWRSSMWTRGMYFWGRGQPRESNFGSQ